MTVAPLVEPFEPVVVTVDGDMVGVLPSMELTDALPFGFPMDTNKKSLNVLNEVNFNYELFYLQLFVLLRKELLFIVADRLVAVLLRLVIISNSSKSGDCFYLKKKKIEPKKNNLFLLHIFKEIINTYFQGVVIGIFPGITGNWCCIVNVVDFWCPRII